MIPPSFWRLYVILDPDQCTLPWQQVAGAALGHGVRIIQLRDKRSPTRVLIERARWLVEQCQKHNALCIINDRVDVAMCAGAHGVHVGPDDMAIADVRRLAPSLIVGGSAKSPQMAQTLQSQGAHYLGSGAVFEARPSKPDASAPQGVALIRQITQQVSIPVVGIGGISPENAASVVAAGADGVAVIRAVVGQPDVQAAVQAFWDVLPTPSDVSR